MKTKVKKSDLRKARELSDLWTANEKHMGEMAAFSAACEELGFAENYGWELMEKLDEAEKQEAVAIYD